MVDIPTDVFIAVGSNIEPEANVLAALELLQQHVRVIGVSTLYRTAPVGRPDQAAFINGVWRVATAMPPRTLKFDLLRAVEVQLGRVRTPDKYAPRTIDLDVVLYGSLVIDEPGLRIPDPDIRTRPFIAVPLLELDPHCVLPDTGEFLAAIVRPDDRDQLEPLPLLTDRLRRMVLP